MRRPSLANETIVGSRSRSGGLSLASSERRRGDEIRELVRADVPGDVRELLGELIGKLMGHMEAGLEVGVEHDRICPAVRDRSAAGGTLAARQEPQ